MVYDDEDPAAVALCGWLRYCCCPLLPCCSCFGELATAIADKKLSRPASAMLVERRMASQALTIRVAALGLQWTVMKLAMPLIDDIILRAFALARPI